MSMSLNSHVAIVTGGGRGLGAACAQILAEQGASVVISSRTQSELEVTASKCDRIFYCVADVSIESEVEKLFSFTRKKLGTPTILINCAAMIEVKSFLEMDQASWSQMFLDNVNATVFPCRKAIEQMKKGGSIVNIGSLAGVPNVEKFPGTSAYATAKGAILAFTQQLAVEAQDLGVRVNAVAPGAFNSEMLKKAAPFLETTVEASDVAKAVIFLAVPENSAKLTGSVYVVDTNSIRLKS